MRGGRRWENKTKPFSSHSIEGGKGKGQLATGVRREKTEARGEEKSVCAGCGCCVGWDAWGDAPLRNEILLLPQARET